MAGYNESSKVQERREWREEGERLRDLEEDYQAAKEANTVTEELTRKLTETRRAYRQRGEATGKRAGLAVTTIWWKRWLEIGVNHELVARKAFHRLLVGEKNTDVLLAEFDNSTVSICSAAFAVEALHNDLIYVLPPNVWKRQPKQIQRLGYLLRTGWELDESAVSQLIKRIDRLLLLRGDAAHAYPETLLARPHPAGLNAGAEHELFNAVTSAEQLDLAIELVQLTATRPASTLGPPYDRWLLRWVRDRQPYLAQVHDLQSRRDKEPLKLPTDR